MSQRHSNHHFWNPGDVLGSGVSGTVFLCRSKETGKKFAAKVLNAEAQRRPHEVRMREAEVLRHLQHPNIVALHAIEEESSIKTMVLIMEVCDASLQSILERPCNHFGLADSHFLVAIGDITSGMCYLRSNNIVHRDVKPGNILGKLQDDSSFRYKLTDFGAARCMDDEHYFTSIYGTEEYLHPDIYEQAVLKKASGKKFTAAVDLWSLGCTFYQCATGKLPFRPYGKRNNREIMFEMISTKKPNVISGVQPKDHGPVEYSDKLPDASQMSNGLRQLVVPMIQGLLQVDPLLMFSFEQYADCVTAMVSSKSLHAFNTTTCSFHAMYTNKDTSFSDIQGWLTNQTGVAISDQMLFHRSQPFSSVDVASISTSLENPILLVECNSSNRSELKRKTISKPPSLTSDTRLEMDYATSKAYAVNACELQSFAVEMQQCCRALHSAYCALGSHYQRRALEDYPGRLQWHLQFDSKGIRSQCLKDHHRDLQALVDTCNSAVLCSSTSTAEKNSDSSLDEASSGPFSLLVAKLEDLRGELVMVVNDVFKQRSLQANDSTDQHSLKVISTQISNIVKTCERFCKDKSMNRALTPSDELAHSADKIAMRESFVKLAGQVEGLQSRKAECFAMFNEMRRSVIDLWSNMSAINCQLVKALSDQEKVSNASEDRLLTSVASSVNFLTEKLSVGFFREYDMCPNCDGLESGLQSLQDMLPDLISLAETEKIMIQKAQNLIIDQSDADWDKC